MPRRLAQELARVLDRRARDDQEARPSRVVGRNTDGTLQLAPLDGQCTTRGPKDTAYGGQIIRDVEANFEGHGSTGSALVFATGAAGVLLVEELEPAEFEPDNTYNVVARGVGFQDGMRFELLLPDSEGELNPDITVTVDNIPSAEQANLDVVVAAGAAPVSAAALAYGYEPEATTPTVPPTTTLTRRLPEAYAVVEPPATGVNDYYAFGIQGSTLHAWRYSNGLWQADRATAAAGLGGEYPVHVPVLILSDPSATVGDGSLAWRTASGGSLQCWDVAGDTLHSYSPGKRIGQVTTANGYLYWVEHDASSTAGQTDFLFRRSRGDFGDITTVANALFAGNYDWHANPVQAYATSLLHVAHVTGIDNVNFEDEIIVVLEFFFTGAGSAAQADQERDITTEPPVGIAINAGLTAGAGAEGDLLDRLGAVSANWLVHWGGPAFSMDESLNVGRAPGGDLCLYGKIGPGLGATETVHRAAQGATGTPTVSFEPEAHPTVAVKPLLMYPKD